MDTEDRFATRANRVEETPEPFRGVLRDRLSPRDKVLLLAFSPASTSQGVRSPATLLALTDRFWLVVSDDIDGGADVAGCPYDDTLLVELTEILLYGQLKIDHVARGMPRACAIEFNTVTEDLYREAVRLILRGIEGGSSSADPDEPGAGPSLEGWPIKFRSAATETLPEDRRLTAAARWPAVYGGFRRELAPAAALVATDRELVLISEERAWVRGPQLAKYGHIATYVPLVRLARADFRRHDRFGILGLEMHASHGGETLEVLFPLDQAEEIARVVECALRQSSAPSSNLDVS
jgi:hypothetical protein